MALALPDRVLETSTTTGTGTYTLAGAVTGFQPFAAVGDSNTCYYSAWDVDGNGNPSGGWEVGLGTYTASGTTLARTSVLASSNSGSAVSWTAGTRRVAVVVAGSKFGQFADVALANTFTAAQTIASGTTTSSTPAITLTQTWNASGTTFTAALVNVTNTASAAASKLLDLQVGGSSVLSVRKDGALVAPTTLTLVVGAASCTFDQFTNCSGIGYLTLNSTVKLSGAGSSNGAVLQIGGSASSFPNSNATIACQPKTPSQITNDTNNYAPGVARYYRLSTDASRTVTGLSCSQVDGQECEVWNVGSNSLVLAHQNASSTAANRFICTGAADITLAADEIALLRYDATTARWRARKV